VAGDRWIEVADVGEAVAALGAVPRRAFLAIGRQEVGAFAAAPQHDYLIRSVDPVEPPLNVPHANYIVARGPFSEDAERALLQQHRIEFTVAKNSGGQATYGKIAAARTLGISVIMLRRPMLPDVPTAETIDDAVAWLDHPPVLSVERGV
jgi:precorrin-6A/cobalt-precorrin-6A reductase